MSAFKNLNIVKNELKRQGKQLENKVMTEIEIAGRLTEMDAKIAAPKDFGNLTASIHYERTKAGMGARITANVLYAPYQEFGTGGSVSIPNGWEKVAAPFKKGGNKINIPAHPFLIPSAIKNYERMIQRLKLTKK